MVLAMFTNTTGCHHPERHQNRVDCPLQAVRIVREGALHTTNTVAEAYQEAVISAVSIAAVAHYQRMAVNTVDNMLIQILESVTKQNLYPPPSLDFATSQLLKRG